jgi:hypothetical protein
MNGKHRETQEFGHMVHSREKENEHPDFIYKILSFPYKAGPKALPGES